MKNNMKLYSTQLSYKLFKYILINNIINICVVSSFIKETMLIKI